MCSCALCCSWFSLIVVECLNCYEGIADCVFESKVSNRTKKLDNSTAVGQFTEFNQIRCCVSRPTGTGKT